MSELLVSPPRKCPKCEVGRFSGATYWSAVTFPEQHPEHLLYRCNFCGYRVSCMPRDQVRREEKCE